MPIYWFWITIGILTGMTISWLETRRRGISQKTFLKAVLVGMILGLIGSKFFHMIFDELWWYYKKNPLQVLNLVHGGQVFYGALLFGLAGFTMYIHYTKDNILKFLDVIAIGIPIGTAIGRVGCYMVGCCYGKPTTLPWGIQYGRGYPATISQIKQGLISASAKYSLPIHPTQLYCVVANIVIFILLLALRKRIKTDGLLAIIYLISYSLLRNIIEEFRADPRGSFFGGIVSTSQVIGGIVFVIAIVSGTVLIKVQGGKRQ